MTNKKRVVMTLLITTAAAVLILLAILSVVTESFAVNVFTHIYLRVLFVPYGVLIIRKCFKNQITSSMNKVLILCGGILLLEVIVDGVRYALNGGVSTLLFLPVYIPLCFMVIMYYTVKDTGREKSMKTTYWLGIPLLLLALYTEVISFIGG